MKNFDIFRDLSVEEKYKYVEEKGTFLMDRVLGNRKIYLYSFEGFFCEVWLLELPFENPNFVTEIKLFNDIAYLDPYLCFISIGDTGIK